MKPKKQRFWLEFNYYWRNILYHGRSKSAANRNKVTIAKIHRDIEYWAKVQKENYYKNWYMVEKNKLNDSLKLGLLTESQYKEKLSMLEIELA